MVGILKQMRFKVCLCMKHIDKHRVLSFHHMKKEIFLFAPVGGGYFSNNKAPNHPSKQGWTLVQWGWTLLFYYKSIHFPFSKKTLNWETQFWKKFLFVNLHICIWGLNKASGVGGELFSGLATQPSPPPSSTPPPY